MGNPLPSGQSVGESAGAATALKSALQGGLRVLDAEVTLKFVKYVKLVLPFDGYVFWVRAELVSPSSLLNAGTLNAPPPLNTPSVVVSSAPFFEAPGSLHITQTTTQTEDDTYTHNDIIFTSEQEVTDLNAVSPTVAYIANYGPFRYAFSQKTGYYQQADLHHYKGEAIFPALTTQIIDDLDDLDRLNPIVSDSLPIWLLMNQYFPVYPSFLVPDNILPPFAAVHIPPDSTRALQAIPWVDPVNHYSWQLMAEHVRITLYGVRNHLVLQYLNDIVNSSRLYDRFGLTAPPVLRDDKRFQPELSILAQKKTLDLDISYYQTGLIEDNRQLIEQALIGFFVTSGSTTIVIPAS